MKEIWKKIPDYKDYRVSNYGRVKSLKRTIMKSNGRTQPIPERILKSGANRYGYREVSLVNVKRKTFRVHQLVAIAFLEHKPNGMELVINHKDFNKLNNHVDNLEITTQRENANQEHLKSSSKYRNVVWDSKYNKWKSSMSIDGKTKHLGMFFIEDDAAMCSSLKLAEINRKKELGLC